MKPISCATHYVYTRFSLTAMVVNAWKFLCFIGEHIIEWNPFLNKKSQVYLHSSIMAALSQYAHIHYIDLKW